MHRASRTLGLLLLLALAARSAHALTPAGTALRNQVTATYTGGQAASNSVSTTVLQVAGIGLTPVTAAGSVTAGTAYYPFVITNRGNGADTVSLAASSSRGWTCTVYRDDNADGVHQATETTVLSAPVPLAVGASAAVLLAVAVPAGLALTDVEVLTVTSGFDSRSAAAASCTTTARPSTFQASFTASPVSGPAPLAVTFTDASGDHPVQWRWAFGDGGSATTQHPTHRYDQSGSFTVTLTVRDSAGRLSKFSRRNSVVVSGRRVRAPIGRARTRATRLRRAR